MQNLGKETKITLKHSMWVMATKRIGASEKFKGLQFYDAIYERIVRYFGIPVPRQIRELFDSLQVNRVVLPQPLPPITLGIVCHPKDFKLLGKVIGQVHKHSGNRVSETIIVTTAQGVLEIKQRFPSCKVFDESVYLESGILRQIKESVPALIQGWILQQAAKFSIVLNAENEATLIIDADTLLLHDIDFFSAEGIQTLSYGHDYHKPYISHSSLFSGDPIDSVGISFVTHYQLMQKRILHQYLFDSKDGIINWIATADYFSSTPSEYHSYGEYLTRSYPAQVKILRWGNFSVSSGELSRLIGKDFDTALYKKFRGWNSISVHSYL